MCSDLCDYLAVFFIKYIKRGDAIMMLVINKAGGCDMYVLLVSKLVSVAVFRKGYKGFA